MTDRSGRTYEEYRELYWAEKKRRKELEGQIGFVQTCKEHIVTEDIDCPICRVAELEAENQRDIQSDIDHIAYLTRCVRKLRRQLAAVRAVLDATENENYWQYSIRSRIREAIAGGEDGSK